MRYVSKMAALWSAAMLLHAYSSCAVAAGAVGDPAARAALTVSDVQAVSLIGSGRAGKRLVAVGERGIVIHSDDNGKSWKQARSPVSVSLTAVRFIDEAEGWATGHAGVVLHTDDGGHTWLKQLDGHKAIALMQDTPGSTREDPADTSDMKATKARARQFIADGADKPFLDVYFSDKDHGLVVGAYGIAFATADGGKSWKPATDRFANPRGLHLYAINGHGSAIYVVGEQGSVFRSSDNGEHFVRENTGYRGSFFTVIRGQDDSVIVSGLRGNAYRSADGGNTWQKINIATPAAITAAISTSQGHVLAADSTGRLFESGDNGQSFSMRDSGISLPTSSLIEAQDGSIFSLGLRGISAASITTKGTNSGPDKKVVQ